MGSRGKEMACNLQKNVCTTENGKRVRRMGKLRFIIQIWKGQSIRVPF